MVCIFFLPIKLEAKWEDTRHSCITSCFTSPYLNVAKIAKSHNYPSAARVVSQPFWTVFVSHLWDNLINLAIYSLNKCQFLRNISFEWFNQSNHASHSSSKTWKHYNGCRYDIIRDAHSILVPLFFFPKSIPFHSDPPWHLICNWIAAFCLSLTSF